MKPAARLWPIGLIIPAVVLAAAGFALLVHGKVSAQAPPAPPGPVVPITAATTQRQDVPILLRNIGTVQAYQTVLIRARVDGTLDKVFFEEGQDVKAGDKLAQIDPRPYAATLAQVQAKRASDLATLTNAQRDLARYSSLARSDFASKQQLDTQGATVAQQTATIQGDDANIATAQLNLNFTTITSPIDGRVGLRMVDPGNLIHANDITGLVSITQIHPIAVIFTLPQDSLPAIRAAMAKKKLEVTAFTSDGKTKLAVGELATTDNTIDQTTGTIKLKAVFQNAEATLWPGQFVNAQLQIGVRDGAVTAPSAAVQHGPSGLFVYVIKPDSTVGLQPVEVVQDDGQLAVIGKGLDAGVEIVTNGQSRLQNGVKVSIISPKANS